MKLHDTCGLPAKKTSATDQIKRYIIYIHPRLLPGGVEPLKEETGKRKGKGEERGKKTVSHTDHF